MKPFKGGVIFSWVWGFSALSVSAKASYSSAYSTSNSVSYYYRAFLKFIGTFPRLLGISYSFCVTPPPVVMSMIPFVFVMTLGWTLNFYLFPGLTLKYGLEFSAFYFYCTEIIAPLIDLFVWKPSICSLSNFIKNFFMNSSNTLLHSLISFVAYFSVIWQDL
jgi:hypothetical protein